MIGVIGGYGNIGRYTVSALKNYGERGLKIGGRNEKRSKTIFPDLPFQIVDIDNENSILKFAQGCSVIVNCSGPSAFANNTLVNICKDIKCPLVDVGMNLMNTELKINKEIDTVIIHGAGASPGIAALITRWGGREIGKAQSLKYYMGFSDKFTRTAAEDYLHGSFGEYSLNGRQWKEKKISISQLQKKHIKLPFFPSEITAIPFFDRETAYVAEDMGIKEGEWYTVIGDANIEKALMSVRKEYLEDLPKAVDNLCTITEMATFGHKKYMNILIQYVQENSKAIYTLVLLSQGPAELSGYAMAATTVAVLNNKMETGEYMLSQAKNPRVIIEELMKSDAVDISLHKQELKDFFDEEEGEI